MDFEQENDSDFRQLITALQRWDGRRRLAEGFLWLPRGLLIGLLLAAIVATISRFQPLLTNLELVYVIIVLSTAGLIISFIVLLIQKRTVLQQAQFADRQFKLRERTSTAVEIYGGELSTTSIMASLQLADTLRVARSVNAGKALPLRANGRDVLITALVTLLLAAAVLLPNPLAEILEEQRAVAESIAEQIAAIEALEEEILQDPAINKEQQEALLEPIQGALEQLQDGQLSREQALAVLSEAAADLRELSEATGSETLREALNNAGQTLVDYPSGQALAQALQNGDFAAASAAVNRMADELASLSLESRSALAQDMANAARLLEQVDPELSEELAQAAEALNQGNMDAAEQALRQAAATLQQRAQEQATARQANAAASQLEQGSNQVAQAGQAGQGGQGQGQDGQEANTQNQQSQGQGADGQGSDGGGFTQEQGEGTGGPGPGGGHAESVYIPDAVDLSSEEGVTIELPAECLSNPENCGALINEEGTDFGDEQSLVPYDQVFGDYRDAAYQALDEDYVPLGLRDTIRDYFSSLEP
jgi:hypothetical protein